MTQPPSLLNMLLSRHTKRREFLGVFLGVLGGTFVWPFTTQGQPASLPVVGLLDPRSLTAISERLHGFRKA